MIVSLLQSVCVRESQFVSKLFLEQHEGRKHSSTFEARKSLMRSESYFPALTASVILHVLEPLTGANIDIAILRKKTKKLPICLYHISKPDITYCAFIHIIIVSYYQSGCQFISKYSPNK
ncbi:hypothetical protein AMECASPLE_000090 [Ameca splendens]|uniref:Uncharacterized protein n=1 Tax=Ameca splendens TaxID=208324 RepID=A0ABV0YK43_9TELE